MADLVRDDLGNVGGLVSKIPGKRKIRSVAIPIERPIGHAARSTPTCGHVPIVIAAADDHPLAPLLVASAGISKCFDSRILSRYVHFKRPEIFGDALPYLLNL